jgi:hypothetical protein
VRDDSQGFGIYANEAASHDLPSHVSVAKHRDVYRRAVKSAARAEGRSARDAVDAIGTAPVAMLDRIASELRAPTTDEVAALAAALYLPPGVFASLDMKFRPPLHGSGGNRAAFVFPERDGSGHITALNLRHVDSSKLTYGPRGLFIPSTIDDDDLNRLSEPIVCCEGASDVLALISMNVAGIGRPSNSAGGELLGDWLNRHGLGAGGNRSSKPVVILGENDAKIGGDWPGRDGAERTARIVAAAIGRPVLVAYPPAPVKDVRDHVRRHAAELKSGAVTLRDLGELLVEHLTITAYLVDGVGVVDDQIRVPPLADPTGGDVVMSKIAGAYVDLEQNESAPVRPAGIDCEAPYALEFQHRTKMKRGVAFFPCRKSTCAGCLPRKREHCRGTIQHHLRLWGQPVYRSFVPVYQWKSVQRRLRSRRWGGSERVAANYFCLPDGIGRYLIISSVPATDYAAEMSADDAAARLCVVIMAMLPTTTKTFSTSRGWALLPDPERTRDSDWVKIGKVDVNPRTTAGILEHHKANWTPSKQTGKYWDAAWITWEEGADAGRISTDLRNGQVLPAGDEWVLSSFTNGGKHDGND